MIRAVVGKWDSEYVLRVPKRYIEDNHLKVGDRVAIEEPLILQQNAIAALVRHGKEKGPIITTARSPRQSKQPAMPKPEDYP